MEARVLRPAIHRVHAPVGGPRRSRSQRAGAGPFPVVGRLLSPADAAPARAGPPGSGGDPGGHGPWARDGRGPCARPRPRAGAGALAWKAMRLSALQPERAREPLDAMRAAVLGRRSLEGAAQALTSALYAWFAESVVLARVFATVPFGELPPANQAFVRSVAETRGADHRLREATLVLSLIGTAGVKPAWNDRRRSQGHAGI